MDKLSMRKDELSNAYWHQGQLYAFRARRVAPAKVKRNGWELVIKHVTVTAGVRHTIGQPDIATVYVDTLTDAKMIAAQFLKLVPADEVISTYRTQDVLVSAERQVYDQISNAVVAQWDKVNAR
ncbi:hypothetical protein PBI_HILLTOPFARM_105 [Mycobacterium phage Hilltopfarm]|nr:hypothetical protein PBI_HILLTOPFARM_105 [Mycobacterium phage Hilltopfarm]